MDKTCDSCETNAFCLEVKRCLHAITFAKAGETDVTDEDELTSDDWDVRFRVKEKDVFKEPLKKNVLDIIKSAIN